MPNQHPRGETPTASPTLLSIAGFDWREIARRRGVLQAWVDHLSRIDWTHWCTLTTSRAIGPEDFAVRVRGFARRVERYGHGPVGWFFVSERGELGRWHAHLLLVGTGAVSDGQIQAAWRGRIFADPYENGGGADRYTVKYHLGGEGESEFSDRLFERWADRAEPRAAADGQSLPACSDRRARRYIVRHSRRRGRGERSMDPRQ